MAQWGSETAVVEGSVNMMVVPSIGTNAFDPATPGSVIDDVVIIHLYSFDIDAADGVLTRIKARYVGRSYREWRPPLQF